MAINIMASHGTVDITNLLGKKQNYFFIWWVKLVLILFKANTIGINLVFWNPRGLKALQSQIEAKVGRNGCLLVIPLTWNSYVPIRFATSFFFFAADIRIWFPLIDICYDPQIMESSGAPSVTLIVGSGLSCLALITLAVVYAALWRYVVDKWLCKTTKEAFLL